MALSVIPSTSSGIVRTCCIHLEDDDSGQEEIKEFTAETFYKCRLALSCRNKFGMKYANIQFPYQQEFKLLGYHSKCYRKFTAIKKKQIESITANDIQELLSQPSNEPEQQHTEENISIISKKNTRSNISFLKNRVTGILKKTCIFCNKVFIYKNKKRIGLSACQTKDCEAKIKQYATVMQDHEMLAKIKGVDFVAKEIHYHRLCRTNYTVKFNKKSKSLRYKRGDWITKRINHKNALRKMQEFIKTNILENEDAYLLTNIHNFYCQYFFESASSENSKVRKTDFSSAHLLRKLKRIYKDKIKITKFKGKLVVHSSKLDPRNAVLMCTSKSKTKDSEVENVAFQIRREILNIKKNSLPDQISLKDIFAGECSIPPLTRKFFTNLLCGPFDRRLEENTKVKVESLAQDTIYSVTNGRIKTSKHMEVGIAMKSITGSRKVINILNRLGHSVSYSLAEELETELTYSSFDGQFITPYGIQQKPHLSTALAFDNFDRFVETLSGKDTLHDTVGIIYQNRSDPIDNSENTLDAGTLSAAAPSQRKRRRMFDILDTEIEPYYKKPKLNEVIEIHTSLIINESRYKHIRLLDNLWVISLALLDSDIPMWVGWNSLKSTDVLPVQSICYLPPINESPTSAAVVAHTLNVAQNVALQCQQSYICVTYDLAIAKMAMQIQSEERPKYNNIYIQLGAFHVQMSFFKAVGKYIDESGGPYILTECGILAPGSLKGFLTGTHFNRCKRIHPMFAAALQIVHFQAYLEATNVSTTDIISELKVIQEQKSSEFNFSDTLIGILDGYDKYYQETEAGEHGMTAKFWITYINFIKLYQEFSRSIRTGDFELYLSCLPKIAALMFSMNHQNYARWIVRFFNNLVNVEKTHPGLKETLMTGAISIRRTGKLFSGTPVDLTLEQSINADAANKLTGITSFTNSISARRRWAASHSLRASLVTHLLESLKLNSNEDVTNDLRGHKLKTDNIFIQQLVKQICNILNPFVYELLDNNQLFNLSTGKGATEATKDLLLNINSNGEKLRDRFIAECKEDASRFEKPISRQVVHTFASDNKIRVKKHDGKITEVKVERNLMGRLLVLALEHKIDLLNVLSFPLTAVPLSLSHIDGSMNKTDKSKLFKILEKHSPVSSAPEKIDCIIFDGFFFFHLLGDLPLSFGRLALHILKKLCRNTCKRVDILFDNILTPSIKDSERDRRAGSADRTVAFTIVGGDQKRPNDFLKALRNDSFKSELVNFLINYWNTDDIVGVLGDTILRVNCQNVCYKFYEHNGHVIREIDQLLCCSHYEADTRIIFHISKLPENTTVVVRASDTDILVIALGNMHQLSNKVSLWIEAGLKFKNTLRYLHVNTIYDSLGETISRALPAYHAFTGSDYTASFARKGKTKPLNILQKEPQIAEVFASFGSCELVSEEKIVQIEKFVCKMYGRNNITRVNEARFDLFVRNYGINASQERNPLDKIKNFDSILMPPCKNSLLCKIKRVNQICAIWNSATEPEPKFYKPQENGWILVDNKYQIEWFEGPQTPPSLADISATPTASLDSDDECTSYNQSSDEED